MSRLFILIPILLVTWMFLNILMDVGDRYETIFKHYQIYDFKLPTEAKIFEDETFKSKI